MGTNRSNHFCNHRCRHLRGNFLNVCVIIAVLIVYAVNTFVGKPNCNVQFLHCYLNDLFAMPFILAYTNLLIHWVGRRTTPFTTPLRIVCLTILCVIVWEGFAPMFLSRSTRDPWDVVAYSTGSFWYFMVIFVAQRRHCDLGIGNA